MATAAAPRTRRTRTSRSARRGAIRWDRVGRYALMAVLGIILLLYVSPARRWVEQSGTAGHQQAELDELQREHDQLRQRLRELKQPGAIEREARRLGMVKAGEQAFVIEGLRAR